MRRTIFALAALFTVACADYPVDPMTDAPTLNVSAEHQALVIRSDHTVRLFDGDGNIVSRTCDKVEVWTTGARSLTLVVRCTMPNSTGRTVIYTDERNPLGPGACGRWFDPDGNRVALCDWQETLAPNGKMVFWSHIDR